MPYNPNREPDLPKKNNFETETVNETPNYAVQTEKFTDNIYI